MRNWLVYQDSIFSWDGNAPSMIKIDDKFSWPTDYCSNDYSHLLPVWATQPLDVALVVVALSSVDIVRQELEAADKEGRTPDFEKVIRALKSTETMPHLPGLYARWTELDGKLFIYLGEAFDLSVRMTRHPTSGSNSVLKGLYDRVPAKNWDRAVLLQPRGAYEHHPRWLVLAETIMLGKCFECRSQVGLTGQPLAEQSPSPTPSSSVGSTGSSCPLPQLQRPSPACALGTVPAFTGMLSSSAKAVYQNLGSHNWSISVIALLRQGVPVEAAGSGGVLARWRRVADEKLG